MSHKCEAAVITCEDFRLHQRKDGRNYIADFVKSLGVDADLITRGGSIQDLVRPETEGFCECLFRDSRVSAVLHSIKTIYLVNHEDCGAYGALNFASKDEEFAKHAQDLRDAKKKINERFPEVEVKLFFAYLAAGTSDVFEIKALA